MFCNLRPISPTYTHSVFSRKQDEKFFLANSAWQTTQRLGKFSIDFSLKSGESIVGEIEERFFAKRYAPTTYCLAKKVW